MILSTKKCAQEWSPRKRNFRDIKDTGYTHDGDELQMRNVVAECPVVSPCPAHLFREGRRPRRRCRGETFAVKDIVRGGSHVERDFIYLLPRWITCLCTGTFYMLIQQKNEEVIRNRPPTLM